jgi:hypothetical protein
MSTSSRLRQNASRERSDSWRVRKYLGATYNLYFGQLPCTKINLVDLFKREDLSEYTAMLSRPRSQRNYMFLQDQYLPEGDRVRAVV